MMLFINILNLHLFKFSSWCFSDENLIIYLKKNVEKFNLRNVASEINKHKAINISWKA